MDKVSIELFKVHNSFKVKFNVVIKSDPTSFMAKNNNNLEIINKFVYNGNNYTNITPHPFLTIDITSWMDKNEGWNSNNSFNLTRRDNFNLIQRLSRIYMKFTKVEELFYYDHNDMLMVNTELANKHKEVVVCGNKTILIQACVVEDSNTKLKYEGVFLSINSIDYFTYLTYSELEFLIYELKNIDFSSLTLQLINTYMLTQSNENKQLEVPQKQPIIETKEEEIVDNKIRIGIPKPNTIPDNL